MITRKTDFPSTSFLSSKSPNLPPDSDLLQKSKSHRSPRRKARSPGYSRARVRFKSKKASVGKRSTPETPVLCWKFDEREKEERSPLEIGRASCREVRVRETKTVVSTRKLAALLRRLQLPEVPPTAGRKGEKSSVLKDRLGFQYGASHIGFTFSGHHNIRPRTFEAKDLMQSPRSVSGPIHGYSCKESKPSPVFDTVFLKQIHRLTEVLKDARRLFLKMKRLTYVLRNTVDFDPTFQFSNSGMEGATKWDPFLKTSDEVQQIYGHSKHLNERVNAVSVISAMEVEFERAQARIHDLETEKRSSKKKLEHFLKKLSEERAAWRSKEHEKIRAIIDDIKADMNWERKNRQRLEIVNSKLVNELTDAKLSAKRYMQHYEKERKARDLIEEFCDELVKEIGEDKAEVEELKRESMKLRDEVDDERKMLQTAEVWREERVQMKLIDAKVMIEEKYSQMKKLVADLSTFLISTSGTLDAEEMRKAEFLRRAAISVNVQDIREFKYEAPNPDDILSVFEDVNFGGANDSGIEQCVGYSPASHASKVHTVSPEANVFDKKSILRHSNDYIDQSGDEEDESGWETVTHPEDQGSSYSPNWSDPSVNKIHRYSNVSGSRTEWEENGCEGTPVTEIREVCAAQKAHLKKVSSISRLWRSAPHSGENVKIVSVEGMNGRLLNGRLSSGAIASPDRCSGNGGTIPEDLMGQWSSPESGIPHTTRGMQGCIEWPHGVQKSSLKAKLMEAKMDSQKIQLKQVLKQKI